MPFVDMAVEAGAFRRTMGRFATGVGLITVQSGTRLHGMTANAISSLSLDPLLVLACVGKQTTMAGMLRDCGAFAINFLTRDQEEVARHFAGGPRDGLPPDVHFERWQGGPLLRGSLAAVGCHLQEVLEGGDHLVVIGRVVALAEDGQGGAPLLFYSGRYRLLAPPSEAPQLPPPDLFASRGASIYHGEWE